MPVQMALSRIIISEFTEQQVIYLKEVDGDRAFPILIGIFEATSIERRVKGIEEKIRAVNEKSDGAISQSVPQPVTPQTTIRTQRWTLWLPLQIPDDRSKKTVIEVMPSVYL